MKAFKPLYFNAGMQMDIVVKIHLKAYELALEFNKEMQLNHPIIFKRPILHTMSNTVEKDGRNVFVKVSL